jgi:anaerobic magnesium-protoporphyrin IX monomethyl ester cyclase
MIGKEVLLINPPMWSPAAHDSFNALCPPLGLGYLAACLLREGASVEILDLSVSDSPAADLNTTLTRCAPRIIGITAVTQNWFLAHRIAWQAREMCPKAFLIAGGPHVTYQWKEALSDGPFDAVALFESEQTIAELYRHIRDGKLDLHEIAGMALNNGDGPVLTNARPLEKQLDHIPYPARHLLPMSRYGRPGTIMTSRGCPMKCIFCISSTYEGSYRPRSGENVLAELCELRRAWGIREVYLIDNVFTVNAERVRSICAGMIREKLDLQFNCVSRADLVTQELVQCLKAAGCIRIEIGVESGVQEIIDKLEKHLKVEHVTRAADIVRAAGITPMFTFQIGSPFETPESLEQTHRLAASLRAKGAITFFSTMTPFPGTPLVQRAQELGLQIHTSHWSEYRTSNPIYDTPYMDRNSFRRALFRESVSMLQPQHEGAWTAEVSP